MLTWLKKIWTLLSNIIDYVLCAIKQALCWIIEQMLSLGVWIVDQVFALLPASPNVDLGPLQQFVAVINGWVPLDMFFALAIAWATFITGLAVLRWLIRIAPFIG